MQKLRGGFLFCLSAVRTDSDIGYTGTMYTARE